MTIASAIAGLRVGIRTGVDQQVVLPTWRFTKTGGTASGWDAQAYSVETFAATVSLQFAVATITGGGDAYSIGLSADNPDANYTGIDFALINDNGTMYKNENSSLTSLGATVAGDVWQITRTMPGGAVTYSKNGSVVNTSSNTSSSALRLDSSMRFTGDTVRGISITTAVGHERLTWTTDGVTVTQE